MSSFGLPEGWETLPLGSVRGIPVRLQVTFPLLLIFSLLASGVSSWAALAWAALLYGPILLTTVLIHELGHALAAVHAGGEAHGILLWPLGGLAYIGHSSGPRADLLIALAGPLTHVPMLLLWLAVLFPVYHAAYGSWAIGIGIPSPSEHFGLAVVAGAIWLNISLACFNLLLPAYPLDGGRIFADAMLLAGVAPQAAAKVTAGVAVVLGLGVLGLGIWQFNTLTVLVGAWMLWSTWQLVQAIRAGQVEQHPLFAAEGGGAAEAAGAKGPHEQWSNKF